MDAQAAAVACPSPACAMRTRTSTRMPSLLQLLSLSLLALCLLAVWSATPIDAAASAPAAAGSISVAFLDLFRQALLAYQLQVPTFTGVTLSFTSGLDNGMRAVRSTQYDWVVDTNSLPDWLRGSRPTLEAFPIATISVAPAYNLPATVGSATLALDALTLCRMWRGNITHWNDGAIAATNSDLRLPAERIIFAQMDFAHAATLATSRLCTKVDPEWASTIGVTSCPVLPHTVGIAMDQGSAGIASFVLDHPWSIGLSSPVATIKVPRANMINQAGKNVAATPATVAQSFLELAQNGVLEDDHGFDLTNPQSAFAWPVNICGWLFIDTNTVRSTCATKAEVLKFLLWMYESPVVASLAKNAHVAMLPAMYLEQSNLLSRLRHEVLCRGDTLVSSDSTSASISGNAMLASSVDLMTQLYAQIDSTYSYSFETTEDALALDRIAVGEIDFAIVANTAVTTEQLDRFLAPSVDAATGAVVPGGMILPAFIVGAVPTFSLPRSITALHATRTSANDLGLPDLYPLTIDIETLAQVFTAAITSWLHPAMTKLNPQLEAWFSRTGASTELRSVVCCTDETDPFVAGHILAQHLLATNAMNATLGPAGVAAALANPHSLWSTLQSLHPSPSPMTFVDREGTVPAKLTMQPGSVSYERMDSATADPATDFQLQVRNMFGALETVPGSPANIMACLEPFVGYPEFVTQFLAGGSKKTSSISPPGCWSLQSLASLAVGSTFLSKNEVASGAVVVPAAGDAAASHQSACVRAQKNLELLRWMQLSPVLSGAMRNSGVVRLSDLPLVRSFLVDQRLNTATCDGKTILITLPILWSVPNSATIFSIVVSIFIIVACLVTIAGLYKFRHHTAIRGASPLFLAQVAIGLALVAMSLIAWASPVTESSCLTFQWLVDLGFTLAFAPLFAKTWRIYQIFSAKKIKVVKITNGRLVWVVLAMLAFELIVLAVWTGVSPLRPVLYEHPTNQLDGAMRHMTHCAVEGAGVAFLAIEAAFKGALLLFGCLMAFSTRKVASSFNESQTIAWSIYNVVFSSLVVGAILLFLDTLGDTLIWLVLILFLWTAAGTWALIFLPKASAVLSGGEGQQQNPNAVSLGSLSKHDGTITFASITGLGRSQLLAYRSALEAQLEKVRRALGIATARADSEGKVLNARSAAYEREGASRGGGSELQCDNSVSSTTGGGGSGPAGVSGGISAGGGVGGGGGGRAWTKARATEPASESQDAGRTTPAVRGGSVSVASPSGVVVATAAPTPQTRPPLAPNVRRTAGAGAESTPVDGIVTINMTRLRSASSNAAAAAANGGRNAATTGVPTSPSASGDAVNSPAGSSAAALGLAFPELQQQQSTGASSVDFVSSGEEKSRSPSRSSGRAASGVADSALSASSNSPPDANREPLQLQLPGVPSSDATGTAAVALLSTPPSGHVSVHLQPMPVSAHPNSSRSILRGHSRAQSASIALEAV